MKQQHYFSKIQKSRLKLRKIKAVLRNRSFYFYTGSGIFSAKKVDLGTKLLINKAIIRPVWKILDLGCGYGPVGIAMAKVFPSAEVFMTDLNKRAVRLSLMNAKLNIVKVVVKQGNVFSAFSSEKFDTILLNPPQSAGKDVCFQMIKESKEHLADGGLLQLVARHNKGGKVFSTRMKELFGNVKEIAKKSGYRIYLSRFD